MARCYILLLLLQALICDGYKVLIFSPTFGYSHMKFLGSIADILTEAGHDVTVLIPIMDMDLENRTGVKITKNIIKIPAEARLSEMMKWRTEMVVNAWVTNPSFAMLIQPPANMTRLFTYMCEGVFNDEELMNRLRERKFDLGIAEAFDICGFGIFELAEIPATIATFSSVHADALSTAIGEPITPSYIPGPTSTFGDRMNIIGRLINTLEILSTRRFCNTIYEAEVNAFRRKFGAHFKGYTELLSGTSFVLTNSNPYLDYPRPVLHKTVAIGGVGISVDRSKNKLSEEWDAILNERNTTVLISFGSVAKAIYMPESYKQGLLKTFETMPDTTFIMKYEDNTSKFAYHLPNVHLSKWFPQNALLADPRLTAFVTHGGLGSVTEVAYQGKPAVLIPIFAEQPRNAHMLAKHRAGIVLTKYDLENPKKLRDALLNIFTDVSYTRNAKRLSEMLLSQPISPKKLVLRHVEFAARFGRLPNLDPYGRQLSFMQYLLLDIALVVVIISASVVCFSVRLCRICLSHSFKAKKD
ncbi:UDP-glucoronosyl and UDP-glucosyl transferase [Oesophagostomum dentatum]|uniref:glucuronosyltransferase n=1 Tax=Oesophagostomum dentatum TaxID=61180 RepID=A0A0B1TFM7_OESDE|nr:UDP-glucoronosyl and UDP-glucosyl transferase [Oesophagostomum dentatum]